MRSYVDQRDGLESILHESLDLFRQAGDRVGTAEALLMLGREARVLGRTWESGPLFEQALTQSRQAGHRPAIVQAVRELGLNALVVTEDYGRAEELYREGLAYAQDAGDGANTAYFLHGLGRVALRRGRFEEARSLFEEALRFARENGSQAAERYIRFRIAILHRRQGQFDEAERRLKEMLAWAHEKALYNWVGHCLGQLALVATGRGQMDRAARLLGAKEAAWRQTGHIMMQPPTWGWEKRHTPFPGPEYQAYREEGRTMTIDEAVRCGLGSER
jgi:tetratricopeptide (TPR) repeat protein